MSSGELGRLKTTTKEKCPSCGHALQLRIREVDGLVAGVQIENETEYLYCPNCLLEGEVKNKGGKPWKRVDKDAFRREGGGDVATGYKKRNGTQRGNYEKGGRSSRSSFR